MAASPITSIPVTEIPNWANFQSDISISLTWISGVPSAVWGIMSLGTNFTKERRIEPFWWKCRYTILPNGINKENEISEYLQPINVAYAQIKEHFPYTDRRITRERYLEHLVRTAYNLLEKTPNPNRLSVLIALLHDIIENTDVTYQDIIWFFRDKKLWKKVALGVLLLSKKSIKDFITDKESRNWKLYQEIERFSKAKERSWGYEMRMINWKWFLVKDFKLRAKKRELSKKEESLYKGYKRLKTDLKSAIDNDYYPRFETKENMITEAKWLNIKYSLWLSPEEIEEVSLCSLDAKDWDRLDNLETEHESSRNKIRKKIKEFNDHFRTRISHTKPCMIEFFDTAIWDLQKLL